MSIVSNCKTNCKSCLQLDVFGFRPLETFNSSNSNFCECIISEKDIILDFLIFMQSNNLLLSILESFPEDIPPRKYIELIMSSISQKDITKKLESSKVLNYISDYIINSSESILNGYVLNSNEYLDIGCGSDSISKEVVRKLKNKKSINRGENSKIVTKNGNFMVISCLFVLHRTNKISKLLKRIYRMLKPGGILIIREFNCESWRDSYSLNFMHQLLKEESFNDSSHIINYRSKKGWRKIITETCKFVLLKDKFSFIPKDCPYYRYFDVFQKI
jgi:hypothetical protein